MLDAIDQVIAGLGFNILATVEVPERPETRAPLPKRIAEGPAYPVISKTIPGGQVWKHQAQALRDLTSGKNVVVSTGTASGKSLIFQTYALHLLLTDPGSKVLVFYPLRALTNDQLISWQRLAEASGLGQDAIGLIYGGVPVSEREQVIESSRIVLMTPDVCQAWLMRTLGSEPVNRFIDDLSLLILDETHVYESVLGSNTAFLLRRLTAAKRHLPARGTRRRLQVIAATATIDTPAQHLENLTGFQFKVVDESVNGAPRSPRRILHVEGQGSGREGESTIATIVSGICAMAERHRFISFVDSRQGVERIVRLVDNPGVKPYRSGFEIGDRATIERTLRNGVLNGVVSTSALELGIDISDMDIGVNLGVPQSRKGFRQRLGRVGRVMPGVFLVIAPANAFTRFGETLSSYYESSVEPSYLYLGNRFVQFAHARCLRDEMESLGRNPEDAPAGVQWPDGFSNILKFARVGYPKEFDPMAQIGGDSPHFNYPLRQLGEINVEIRQGRGGFDKELGEMAYHQAIREAYPGATYLHLGNAYKVNQWNRGFNKLAVRVAGSKNAAPTRPILRKSVTIDVSHDGIIPGGRIKKSAKGFLAEAQVQVNESVEGFIIGNTHYMYRELRAKDPNMSRKQRDFRTTGVVVEIGEDWFSDSAVRREVAEGLRDLLSRERSIAPQDIDCAHTNIALATDAGIRRPITDVVVIYDSVYGGLHLTENLFDEFSRYIERLSLGAELSHGEGIISAETSDNLRQWAQGLSDADDFAYSQPVIEPPADGNWIQVFKPGSLVGVFRRGELLEREIIEPRYISLPGEVDQELYYSYQDPANKGGTSSTPADSTQPVGQDWEWVWWNPDTGEYRDLEVSE